MDKWDNEKREEERESQVRGSCLHNKQLQAMGSFMQQVRSSSLSVNKLKMPFAVSREKQEMTENA